MCTHSHYGTLWEDRCHSVIVEDGTVARRMGIAVGMNSVREWVACPSQSEMDTSEELLASIDHETVLNHSSFSKKLRSR